MEEKELIRNKLDARKKLSTLTNDELMNVAKDEKEFDRFISGLAGSMSSAFACYAYKYFGVIKNMININLSRAEQDDNLGTDVHTILFLLKEYDSKSRAYKAEFTNQYESLEGQELGLLKLGFSLTDFDKKAVDVFDKIENGRIDEVKTDKYYLPTVSYLSKYHPEYLKNCHLYPEIRESLTCIDKNDFDDKKEYKKFKSVAGSIISRMDKYSKKREKVLAKEKKGYYC